MKNLCFLFFLFCVNALFAQSPFGRPAIIRDLGIEQRLGAQVPLDLPFQDESGKAVTLRQYTGKPFILALVYYQCPSLCNMVMSGLLKSAKILQLTAGKEYDIVAISFDATETPSLAAAKKAAYIEGYGRDPEGRGWHLLTGTAASSQAVADSVGFRFAFDKATNQFAHPSAIMLLTPEGRVARYLYGIDYPARELRLGLVEASNDRIGSAVDRALLFCFRYDAATSKYGLAIVNLLRVAGVMTALGLIGFLFILLRQERGVEIR